MFYCAACQGREAQMLIEQAHLHRTEWRKLAIALLLAMDVVAMSLVAQLLT
jgi:hypothetical protein